MGFKYLIKLIFFVCLLMVAFVRNETVAQCGCASNTAMKSPMNLIGISESGIIAKKNLLVAALYRLNIANSTLSNDIKLQNKQSLEIHNFYVFASYGLDNFNSLEFNISYAYKLHEQYNVKTSGYGLSGFELGLKRHLYETELSDFNVNLGFGIKAPLMKAKDIDTFPLIIQPSNGAFGMYGVVYLQKSLANLKSNLFFVLRSDYNFRNNVDYFVAPAIQGSFFYSKNLFNEVNAVIGLVSEYKFKDKYLGQIYENSGGYYLKALSMANVLLGEFGLSLFAEIPLYEYLYGEQISNGISFGLMLSFSKNFNRRKL